MSASTHQTRFHFIGSFDDGHSNFAWVGGFLEHPDTPSMEELANLFRENGKSSFERQGKPDSEPVKLSRVHLFRLPDIPRPAPDDLRPLLQWEVDIDLVCHDVKFGAHMNGVFQWPECPQGKVLDAMAQVLVHDALALRGDNPEEYGPWTEVLNCKVAPSDQATDYR